MHRLFDPPAFALEWCRRLSANPKTLEPLQGGINGQVLRCKAGSHWHVIKGFQSKPKSGPDRFKAEVEFLSYAQMIAPEYVPQLLHADEASQSVVLEYIEGERFKDGMSPCQESIDHAITFMRLLNQDYGIARHYIYQSAAEGFLQLTEHVQNIKKRLGVMGVEHLPASIKGEARGILKTARLRQLSLEEHTLQLISQGYVQDACDSRNRCISPSDFGFHNAIRTPSGVKFFDFEFAGWDDPAKAVADFDLQPRVPIRPGKQALVKDLRGWNARHSVRQKVLAPILELKWACIVLGLLNSSRWVAMTKIDPSQNLEPMFQAKLRLVKTYLLKD